MAIQVKNQLTDTISYLNRTSVKESNGKELISYEPITKQLQMLEIEITLRCPLRCIHCSVNGGESKVDIPLEKFHEIVDDCEQIGVESLDIIGGEPLAYHHIYEALRYAIQKIPKVYLNTAGYFFNEKIIQKLQETGLKDIFISLDGATQEKHEKIRGPGTFYKTLDAIKKMSEAGFYLIVSFVANAENYTDIPAMLDLCERYGAKKLFILSLIPEGRGKNIKNLVLKEHMIKTIFESISKYKGPVEIELDCSLKTDFEDFPDYVKVCPAGTTFCTIKVNGDVIPCGFLPSKFSIGNIYQKRFYDIWNDDRKFYFWRKGISGCQTCSIYKECRGGCQALKFGKVCEGDTQKRINLLKEIKNITRTLI